MGLVECQATSSAGDGVAVEVSGDGDPVEAVARGDVLDAGSGSVGVQERSDGGRG